MLFLFLFMQRFIYRCVYCCILLLLLFLIISLFALTVMYLPRVFLLFYYFFFAIWLFAVPFFICAPFAEQMHCFCLSKVKGPCSCAGAWTHKSAASGGHFNLSTSVGVCVWLHVCAGGRRQLSVVEISIEIFIFAFFAWFFLRSCRWAELIVLNQFLFINLSSHTYTLTYIYTRVCVCMKTTAIIT